MVNLAGYAIFDRIYAGSQTLVYRGERECDRQPVILKLLNSEYPNFNELLHFRNQYSITKNLDIPGIIRPYNLESYRNSYVLVMEDFGGVSLREYTQKQTLSLVEVLDIAIQLCDILHPLHHNRVIHKDIKPANILIHPATKQIKLIDFSIASLLPKETQEIKNPNGLEGTLAYLSPEQTGRMNRGIDYRADFYALGVTLFELLAGELPFRGTDPMELVHCHIAKVPPALSNRQEIPQAVSDIVMKLMAKNAEDRYQSALGLKYDLENCWRSLQETGKIADFIIAQRDVCDRFLIPEKLYGREAEVDRLLSAFERVAQGNTEIILVAGFSGIGKTAVVNEVHKPIVRQRGYFIKGKFDQFNRDIPFSAFVQAFRDLMGQLLSESDVQLEDWKAKIIAALGESAQVMIDAIPELESLIGKQPPVPELSGIAAQNRFNLLFQKFIQLFTKREHPLVIFLDDLQWADLASLKLMQLLMDREETGYLLLIGAYRDNEVFAAHPLMLAVDAMAKADVSVNTMTLTPLILADINQLVADTLSCEIELAKPLTELVYSKTKGNPFFTTQLLKSLHEDGSIAFTSPTGAGTHHPPPLQGGATGGWECDIAQVRTLTLTDDVVEFMALQLQKLPPATQNLLKIAACIGNTFDLETLAIVWEKSQFETASDLWKALQEGLVLPQSEIYKFFQTDGDAKTSDRVPITNYQLPSYRFLHDRVQQAAYSLIPDDRKQATHLKIGQLLLQNIPQEAQHDRIFDIVNHLNAAKELITSSTERDRLAELNWIAARKAKISTAYASASNYLKTARSLLDINSWKIQYNLTLKLYLEATEVAYLNGDLERIDPLAQVVIDRAKTLVERVPVYETKVVSRIVQNKQVEAININLEILKELGVILPHNPTGEEVGHSITEFNTYLSTIEIGNLHQIPPMNDAEKQAAMRLLSSIISAAFVSVPNLLSLLAIELVRQSIEAGNTPESVVGYCIYGVITMAVTGNIKAGYALGEQGLRLYEKLNARELAAKVGDIFFGLLDHWVNPLSASISGLLKGYLGGIEAGDTEYAGYCISKYGIYSFWLGKNLKDLESELATYSGAMGHFKQQVAQNYLNIYWQAAMNLQGNSSQATCLVGSAYNEEQSIPQYLATNDFTGLGFFSTVKLAICYLLGDGDAAINYAIAGEKYLGGLTGMAPVPIFHFYAALSYLASVNLESNADSDRWKQINNSHQKIQEWASHAPANYQHKYELILAEKHRVLGEKLEAIDRYDRAIFLAKENGYIQEFALANELAAKFYLDWGKEKFAAGYMQEAYYAWARWGAKAKTDDLERRYPQLLTPILQKRDRVKTTQNTSSTVLEETLKSTDRTHNLFLDFPAIIKAARAISGEIELEKLTATLMQIAIANAGAQTGTLMLCQDAEWFVVAKADRDNTETLQIPLNECDEIPQSIIYYVARTQTAAVFENLNVSTQFAGDRYIITHQPKSVICIPISDRGKLIGILYLENNLAVGAFSNDRVEVLQLLTSQAAISIENARLYQQIEQYSQSLEVEVERKTKALSQKNLDLEQTLQNLQQTQALLIQSEKMSSLGQLVAGIAHEINNPVNFINGNLTHAETYVKELMNLLELYRQEYPQPTAAIQANIEAIDLDYLFEDLTKLMQSMQVGSDRISKIVLSLRNFSRLDESAMKAVDLHSGLESTLLILQHTMKASADKPEVQAIKEYGNLPAVTCYPSQLNQVLMHILSNAIDAVRGIKNSGQNPEIRIRTEVIDNRVKIAIADNGGGIPAEIQSRIFDPFFTTKPVGSGTGLGLFISYSIINKHGGELTCNSTPNHGTEFAISIPIGTESKA